MTTDMSVFLRRCTYFRCKTSRFWSIQSFLSKAMLW